MSMESIRHTGAVPTPRPDAGAERTPVNPSQITKSERRIAGQGQPGRAEAVREEGGQNVRDAKDLKGQVEVRVEEANRHLEALQHGLKFQVHEDSGEILVQVVDRNTGDVVRESPPRAFLDLAVRMHEMVGAFLDETS